MINNLRKPNNKTWKKITSPKMKNRTQMPKKSKKWQKRKSIKIRKLRNRRKIKKIRRKSINKRKSKKKIMNKKKKKMRRKQRLHPRNKRSNFQRQNQNHLLRSPLSGRNTWTFTNKRGIILRSVSSVKSSVIFQNRPQRVSLKLHYQIPARPSAPPEQPSNNSHLDPRHQMLIEIH